MPPDGSKTFTQAAFPGPDVISGAAVLLRCVKSVHTVQKSASGDVTIRAVPGWWPSLQAKRTPCLYGQF